jgi:hypothetical protein
VYCDTEDLRLAHAGVALRRRSDGHDTGWHLTLPVDGDSRDDDRRADIPVSEAQAGRRRTPPAELTGLVRAFTRGVALGPVASWQRCGAGGG